MKVPARVSRAPVVAPSDVLVPPCRRAFRRTARDAGDGDPLFGMRPRITRIRLRASEPSRRPDVERECASSAMAPSFQKRCADHGCSFASMTSVGIDGCRVASGRPPRGPGRRSLRGLRAMALTQRRSSVRDQCGPDLVVNTPRRIPVDFPTGWVNALANARSTSAAVVFRGRLYDRKRANTTAQARSRRHA